MPLITNGVNIYAHVLQGVENRNAQSVTLGAGGCLDSMHSRSGGAVVAMPSKLNFNPNVVDGKRSKREDTKTALRLHIYFRAGSVPVVLLALANPESDELPLPS